MKHYKVYYKDDDFAISIKFLPSVSINVHHVAPASSIFASNAQKLAHVSVVFPNSLLYSQSKIALLFVVQYTFCWLISLTTVYCISQKRIAKNYKWVQNLRDSPLNAREDAYWCIFGVTFSFSYNISKYLQNWIKTEWAIATSFSEIIFLHIYRQAKTNFWNTLCLF